VKISGARPATLTAGWGAGGLGHLAIQYARAHGSTVVAVDIHDDKLATARELGAEHTVDAATEDAVSAIKALGGADAAIVTAVSAIAFRSAFDAMARGGTLVFVGLPAHNEVEIPIFQTALNGITIKGSIVGTHLDLEEVFRLHIEGRTRVLSETRRLDQVNASIAEVLSESTATPRLSEGGELFWTRPLCSGRLRSNRWTKRALRRLEDHTVKAGPSQTQGGRKEKGS
jgi:propanol-preferring alcohol dehydrogenase